MKLVTIFLINFFAALSVYAGLQWVPYNPQGDYDGNVLVVGNELVSMGKRVGSSGGICRIIEENGVIRVGTNVYNKCRYGTNSHINDVADPMRYFLYHYTWDENIL